MMGFAFAGGVGLASNIVPGPGRPRRGCRDFGQEAGLVRRCQVHAETCRLALMGSHGVLFDAHGTGRIDHNARLARSKKAIPESTDQPLLVLAFGHGQAEDDIGHVDDDPMRIGKRKNLVGHGAGKFEGEPGQPLVARNLAASCCYSAFGHFHRPAGRRRAGLRLAGSGGHLPDLGLCRCTLSGRCFANLGRLGERCEGDDKAGSTGSPARPAQPLPAGRRH